MKRNDKHHTNILARAACVLGLGLALTAAAPVAAQAEYLGYTDIPSDHWAAESQVIDYATGRGIFKGYNNTTFGPDDPVTRAQVATVMYRVCVPEEDELIGNTIFASDRPFANIYGAVANQYYDYPMNWAYDRGLIKGNGSFVFRQVDQYGNTVTPGYAVDEDWSTYKLKNNRSEPNVRPNDNVTREELAVMLQRMAEYRGTYDASQADYAALDAFPDAGSVSGWARDAVAWAVGMGIMGGGGVINPQGNATRAEASKMFEIAIEGEGFTTEGKTKTWVWSDMCAALLHWTCTSCGASSDLDKSAIVHKQGCPANSGGVVWISEDQDDPKVVNLGDLDEAHREMLSKTLEKDGLLTGWYEWV